MSKLLKLLLANTTLLGMSVSLHALNYVYIGADGGDWETVANWQVGPDPAFALPGSADNVLLTQDGKGPLLTGTATITQFLVGRSNPGSMSATIGSTGNLTVATAQVGSSGGGVGTLVVDGTLTSNTALQVTANMMAAHSMHWHRSSSGTRVRGFWRFPEVPFPLPEIWASTRDP